LHHASAEVRVREAVTVRWAVWTAVAAATVQVGPAATWLPAVRRWTPGLTGRGPAGSVAVTFDDGPHPVGTVAVLDALDALGWRSTFFVLGAQARAYPDIVREAVRRGHEIAVHGDEHRYLIARTPRQAVDDLTRARDTVGDIVGAAPRWWRPPYGVLSGPALLAAGRLGLRPVLWSSWGRDWRAEATPGSVVADLAAPGLDGGVLLLHDSDVTSAPGSWRTTVAALPVLAERVQAASLHVRPLGEHAG
jgi:peptidoglycan/xylan/chitin deacetylase (PgdA/CDA1 family)